MVSFDKADDNKRFAETHEAGFPIRSDPEQPLAEPYGVAHERETANRIAWRLTVPAGGEARFHYRLRVTRP